VYGFAQQSGGKVSIQSQIGAGTTVTILLPRSLTTPVAVRPIDTLRPATSAIDGSRRGHALLVEDDREVAALTREMLSCLGFAVTHVVSAEAALGALANDRAIDIVLSDIMLPAGVNGLELAREIKRRHDHVPIILTTGYVEAAAGMKNDEFDLLPKPYTLEALAEALRVEIVE
jgi:CheY-like chemotaxis protein